MTKQIYKTGNRLLKTDAGVKALSSIMFLKDAWPDLSKKEKSAARRVLGDLLEEKLKLSSKKAKVAAQPKDAA